MTREELAAMVAAEEKRLGIGSSDFMERHREIMELADQIQQQYEKCLYQSTSPVKAEEPINSLNQGI